MTVGDTDANAPPQASDSPMDTALTSLESPEEIQRFRTTLETYREKCERDGNYMEAELVTKRLDALKIHDHEQKRKSMKSRQIAERLEMEESHMVEYHEFNKQWDDKLAEYDARAAEAEQRLRTKHENEFVEFKQKSQVSPEKRIKYSKELLNLRNIQETLARQRKYMEAQQVKEKADKLEAGERKAADARLTERYEMLESQFLRKKRQEAEALLKRLKTGREELEKKRHEDLQRLLQRYYNIKAELEAQQNLERIRVERYFLSKTSPTSPATSPDKERPSARPSPRKLTPRNSPRSPANLTLSPNRMKKPTRSPSSKSSRS